MHAVRRRFWDEAGELCNETRADEGGEGACGAVQRILPVRPARAKVPPLIAAMDSKRAFYVRVVGGVRGPLGLEHLREMASVDVITPENEIAENASGPWVRLATLAICADVFPARRVIGFKEAEFEELNRGPTPAMDPNEALAQANRPPAAFRGREVVVTPQVLRRPRDGEPPNEVQEMVLEVGRRVAANEPPVVLPPVPGPFPRWPWFAALSVLG